MKKNISDEEVAFKIVNIYFEEIARLGFKRSLDLDAIINAYFYTLQRIKNKDKLLVEMGKKVMEEEARLKTQSREEMIPSMQERAPGMQAETSSGTEGLKALPTEKKL
ncbi:MAG: hypothetical protein HY392_03935 [Candidatus Diapherotrites archaeon]|nr:hypothetical protein [Candidatus Diapherotrites archaeon]